MNHNRFSNLSCYEEFEIQSALMGISKINILKNIGYRIDDYYFFISNDGIFNWFDLSGNHVEDPGILKKIKKRHIPKTITKCIIPNGVTSIGVYAFWLCTSLKEIIIPNSITSIDDEAFSWDTSLTSIIIPDSVTSIGAYVFHNCTSLKEVIFKGKTLEEIKRMKWYPFGIGDENIIKVSEI